MLYSSDVRQCTPVLLFAVMGATRMRSHSSRLIQSRHSTRVSHPVDVFNQAGARPFLRRIRIFRHNNHDGPAEHLALVGLVKYKAKVAEGYDVWCDRRREGEWWCLSQAEIS